MLLVSLAALGQEQIGSSIHGTYPGDGLGDSVALNSAGDIMVVGIPRAPTHDDVVGRVAVYKFDGIDWEPMGNEIFGTVLKGGFGFKVAINDAGNIIAVTERRIINTFKSVVKTYSFNGNDWMQLGQILFSDKEGENFGYSVDLNSTGNIMAIGIYNNWQYNLPGSVQVYKLENGHWEPLANRINGFISNDLFGRAVSLSSAGNILAVGAQDAEFDGIILGYTQVYQLVDNEWEQLGGNFIGENIGEHFGYSVSLNNAGNNIAIAASPSYNQERHMRLSVFEFVENSWIPKGSDITDENMGNTYISSLCRLNGNGNVLTFSLPGFNFNTGGANIGQVKTYQFLNDKWSIIGEEIIGEAEGDMSGYGLAVNDRGSRIAIGSPGNDNGGNNVGQVRVFDINDFLGAEDFSKDKISVEVYPNPADDILNIETTVPISSVVIMNVLGQSLLISKANGNKMQLDTSGLSAGSYFAKVIVGDSNQILRFIKR